MQAGNLLQTRGRATSKELSPSRVRVRGTTVLYSSMRLSRYPSVPRLALNTLAVFVPRKPASGSVKARGGVRNAAALCYWCTGRDRTELH